jgi:hypothetical protein
MEAAGYIWRRATGRARRCARLVQCTGGKARKGPARARRPTGPGETARRTDRAAGQGRRMEWSGWVLYFSPAWWCSTAAVGWLGLTSLTAAVSFRARSARVAHAPGSATATRTTWSDGDRDGLWFPKATHREYRTGTAGPGPGTSPGARRKPCAMQPHK